MKNSTEQRASTALDETSHRVHALGNIAERNGRGSATKIEKHGDFQKKTNLRDKQEVERSFCVKLTPN